MADHQQIVYEIRNLLTLEALSPSDQAKLRDLALRYTEAVNEVNARLHECDEFVRRGNRDEALRRCKAEPDLLEAVGNLDFLERPQWVELLGQAGVPTPPNLLTDIAEELNEAFAASPTLGQLLRIHRLYALAHAPLRERLALLRKIAQNDRDNAFWQDDIAVYEKARLEQLPAEVEAAWRSHDLKGLARLESELQTDQWRKPPPAAVVERVAQLHAQRRREDARVRLEQLAPRLNEAHAAFDVAAGYAAREAFMTLAPEGILRSDDSLWNVVAPALAWLAEEDQRQEKQAQYDAYVRELSDALEDQATEKDLTEAYQRVPSEFGVPPDLEDRYHERIHTIRWRRKLRNRLILGSAVVAIFLVAGLIWFVARTRAHERSVAQSVAALQTMLVEKNLDAAQQYVTGLEATAPAVVADARVQEVAADLAAAVKAEDDRKTALEQHLLAASRLTGEDRTRESLENALVEAGLARRLAKTEAEEASVASQERQIRQKQQSLQQDIDEKWTGQWKAVQEQVKKISPSDSAAMGKAITELESLQQSPHVSQELTSQVQGELNRLRTAQAEEQSRRIEAAMLQSITAAVGRHDSFIDNLRKYRQKFPDVKRARDFERVAADESSLWQNMKQWDEIVDRWSTADWPRIDSRQAENMIADAAKIGGEQAVVPPPPDVASALAFLRAVALRVDGNGKRLHTALREPLMNKMVSDLLMVMTEGGTKHYFLKPPSFIPDAQRVSFRCVKDFALTEGKPVWISIASIVNPRDGDTFDWTTPQKKFSEAARAKLLDLKDGNWEETFGAILNNLVAERDMDPILKVQLMQCILGVAGKGSHAFQQAFREHAKTLESGGLDPNANWLDPDDEAGKKARTVAQELLDGLPDLTQAQSEAIRLREELHKRGAGPRRDWIGWLCEESDGAWTCRGNTASFPKEPGDLVVVCKASDARPAELAKVGAIDEGKLRMERIGAPLKEGRPVFFVKRSVQ